ncbi:MAG: HNH endonuclease signature motif containing protein [Hyphomonadaceae bacterium]
MEIIKLSSSAKAERVEFNGVVYRRYPQAKRRDDRVYFRCGGGDIAKGFGYLHRDIWKYHHGPIPEGFHVHHKDEDPDNNSIDNLEILPAHEHFKKHPTLAEEIPHLRQQMNHARKFASQWHGSPAGLKWHSEHGKAAYAKRTLVTKTCSLCGSKYETKNRNPKDQFCSNKCRAAHRRSTGVDNIHAACRECGQQFTKNKYSKTLTCSASCAAKRRERRKREG